MKKISVILLALAGLLIWPDIAITQTYTVTLNLTAMSPHLGDVMYFRVVNSMTQAELDRTIVSTVSSANFSVVLSGISAGVTYHLDFFADFNRNGEYNAPPVDHAWRIELPAQPGMLCLISLTTLRLLTSSGLK